MKTVTIEFSIHMPDGDDAGTKEKIESLKGIIQELAVADHGLAVAVRSAGKDCLLASLAFGNTHTLASVVAQSADADPDNADPGAAIGKSRKIIDAFYSAISYLAQDALKEGLRKAFGGTPPDLPAPEQLHTAEDIMGSITPPENNE